MDYSLCTGMDSTYASLCLLLAPKVLQFFSVLEHSLLSEIVLGDRGHHHLFILVYLTTEHNLYNDKSRTPSPHIERGCWRCFK